MQSYNVVVVGATGLVGRTLIDVLMEQKFPINKLILCASSKSIGKEILINNTKYKISEISKEVFLKSDFAFFCAGGNVSKEWAIVAKDCGCVVIDNSNFFRMNKDCSLIIPEVNFLDLNINNIIANPNCSTIQAVICLNALKEYGLKRVIYQTYQSVSGSGNKALMNKDNYYLFNINDTCIPVVDKLTENGFSLEELKMINETRKILNKPNLNVTATCVRVPVDFCHGVSVLVELEKEFNVDEIVKVFKNSDGIIYEELPVSTISCGKDMVYVGRVRKDLSNPKTLMFYCVADNIRRGAASNAVFTALKIIKNCIAYKK